MKIDLSTALKFLLIIALLTGCNSKSKKEKTKTCEDNFPAVEKWKLIVDEESLSKYGSFPKSGYVNENGDTMIQLDTYRCLSDSFEYFGLVQDIKGDRKIYGIDKKGNKLFEGVPTGEGGYPIEEVEGRIMIQKNGKYGFANHKGEVVIEPIYLCVGGGGFYNGKASVSMKCREVNDEHIKWESDDWIFIDKCGNEIVAQK